jgi:aryl-alcohol dehydrogenase-like predicted oxidoreductase
MKYRRLGMWGLQLSDENGINFFDTANAYGGGETETVVGRALAPFRRETYVLATKLFWPVKDWPFPGANDRGLNRKHVIEQCDVSLQRLGVEYIDLYQCHRYDENTPLPETCRAMSDLVDRGKVLYWGVSEWTAEQIAEAVEICDDHGWHQPVSNQPLYNMLERHWEAEVFPTCARLGLGIVNFSPLAEGVLTGKYLDGVPAGTRAADEKLSVWIKPRLTDDNAEKVRKLKTLADEPRARLVPEPAGGDEHDHRRVLARTGRGERPRERAGAGRRRPRSDQRDPRRVARAAGQSQPPQVDSTWSRSLNPTSQSSSRSSTRYGGQSSYGPQAVSTANRSSKSTAALPSMSALQSVVSRIEKRSPPRPLVLAWMCLPPAATWMRPRGPRAMSTSNIDPGVSTVRAGSGGSGCARAKTCTSGFVFRSSPHEATATWLPLRVIARSGIVSWRLPPCASYVYVHAGVDDAGSCSSIEF